MPSAEATNSARSNTCTLLSCPLFFTPSLIMVIQNGHDTAMMLPCKSWGPGAAISVSTPPRLASAAAAPLSVANLPNGAKVPPIVWAQGQGYGAAIRASAVTLAYNSQQVPNPPKTFGELLTWIKAHPGKFTYCKPDQGGTGDYFVVAAIRSVMDTSLLIKPYSKASEAAWPKAWALLKSIEPDLYQNGYHPDGNIPVLNLLAKGTIWMGTAWSDQGLNYLDKGLLPSYVKLTQINRFVSSRSQSGRSKRRCKTECRNSRSIIILDKKVRRRLPCRIVVKREVASRRWSRNNCASEINGISAGRQICLGHVSTNFKDAGGGR